MFKVLRLNEKPDIDEYMRFYNVNQKKDPYFLLDYINVFNNKRDGLISFVFFQDNKVILLPGYLTENSLKKDKKYFDFISPYGYTGPYVTDNVSDAELKNFWSNIDNWYKENEVVSEFIRFNLYDNKRMYSGSLAPTMLNVKGVILDDERQWSSFDHKVRKNVKKALRENLVSKISFGNEITSVEIQSFVDIYNHTMQRTNANENFFYELDDFIYFITNNRENTAICNIYLESKVISSELVLVSDDSLFSFLGGTDVNYFDKRPNDLLKYELINWARAMHKKYYVLGGGYGFEDGIFRYKKSFFPDDIATFCTGRKIINESVYVELHELNNTERLLNGLEPLDINDPSFFPIYNKKK